MTDTTRVTIEAPEDVQDLLGDALSGTAVLERTKSNAISGDPTAIHLVVEVLTDLLPVVSAAIAVVAHAKSKRSVKVNGIEAKGLSAKDVLALIEASKKSPRARTRTTGRHTRS